MGTEPMFHFYLKEPYKDPDDIHNFDREKQTQKPKDSGWRGEKGTGTPMEEIKSKKEIASSTWEREDRERETGKKNRFPWSTHTAPLPGNRSRATTRDIPCPSCRSQFSRDPKIVCIPEEGHWGGDWGRLLGQNFCLLMFSTMALSPGNVKHRLCKMRQLWHSGKGRQQSLSTFRLVKSLHLLETEDNNDLTEVQ